MFSLLSLFFLEKKLVLKNSEQTYHRCQNCRKLGICFSKKKLNKKIMGLI